MVFGFGKNKAEALIEKAAARQDAFVQSGRKEDLDAAIDLFKQAVEAKGYDKLTDEQRGQLHGELARRLVERHNVASRRGADVGDDAEQAIVHFKRAIEAPNEGARPQMLQVLSDLSYYRASRAGDVAAAKEAVQYAEAYAETLTDNAPEKIDALVKLAERGHHLFDLSGEREALDSAIDAGEAALKLAAGEGETGLRFMLAHFRARRFDVGRDVIDIEQAVLQGETALNSIGGMDRRYLANAQTVLTNVAKLLELRANAELLERAIAISDENDPLIAPDDPMRADHLRLRGGMYWRRNNDTRADEDLDVAIEALAEAYEITDAENGTDSELVESLRNALILRFALQKRRADVDQAIKLTQLAMGRLAGRGPVQVHADSLRRELEDLEMRRDALDQAGDA